MNKKIINLITSGVLLFNVGAPTGIMAKGEQFSMAAEEASDNAISLSKILGLSEESYLYKVFEKIYIYDYEDYYILSGDFDIKYKIRLIDKELKQIAEIYNKKITDIELDKKLIAESDVLLTISHAKDDVEIEHFELSKALSTYLKEDQSLHDNLTEENQDNIQSDFKNKSDDEIEYINNEKEEKNKVHQEENPVDNIDVENPLKEVSYPRSTEVEKNLHGENYNDKEVDGLGESEITMFSASRNRKDVNGIYTVQAGDTFNDIAKSFNLTTPQLSEWNKHISNINALPVGSKLAINRRGVESMLSATDKKRLYNGGSTPDFSTPQQFINFIAPIAIKIANQSGEQPLWASLMIAQAAHESNYGRSALASSPYYNLSGIKGTHNGNSVLMWTWEVYNGNTIEVLADFRQYPSYNASLQDYANLLRYGLTWDQNYYSGTWRSNTKSVWDVLDNGGLRGYATDPNYFSAIRRIINQYDLTQYDTGNYYVQTGTFLGEEFTRNQMNKLKNENNLYNYEVIKDEYKTPYSYRRIESIQEFLGEAGAQKAVDKMKKEKGWSATIIPTGNSTKRKRVWSGWFNSLAEAEAAATKFAKASNYAVLIDEGADGKYRIRTGFFNSQEDAQKGLREMNSMGWSAKVIESSDSTPHYKIRTGTFNTPNHVSNATSYFNTNGWGNKEILDTRNNYYYRIVIEGFLYKEAAASYVSHLSGNHNWYSRAFLIEK